MSSELVCQVARSWVDVGSFHTRLVVRFMVFTASVRNILDTLVATTVVSASVHLHLNSRYYDIPSRIRAGSHVGKQLEN
jgi:uncharacterized RDD family membrane protein YckC